MKIKCCTGNRINVRKSDLRVWHKNHTRKDLLTNSKPCSIIEEEMFVRGICLVWANWF